MTRKILLTVFWTPVIISLLAVVLFESELLLPGDLAHDAVLQLYVVGILELLTICLIPLALRLFKFKRVAAELQTGGEPAYRTWSIVRIDMLTTPMVINTLGYYLTLNVALGYLAILGLLALPFIYPSKRRCEQWA